MKRKILKVIASVDIRFTKLALRLFNLLKVNVQVTGHDFGNMVLANETSK